MSSSWYSGNAHDDAGTNRGWLLGHFMNDQTRNTEAVEVKWGIHPAGQRRDEWTSGERRSTLLILVSGRFRLDTSTGSVTMKRQGDYVVWGKGIDHSWQAEDDSIVITVRWPSLAVQALDSKAALNNDAGALGRSHTPLRTKMSEKHDRPTDE